MRRMGIHRFIFRRRNCCASKLFEVAERVHMMQAPILQRLLRAYGRKAAFSRALKTILSN